MNKLKGVFFAILFLVLFIPFSTKADEDKIRLYLFHQNGCPHCEAELEFLESIEDDYPRLEIVKYEVSENAMNYSLYNKVMKKTRIYENGVPFTMIGTDYFIGFDEDTGTDKEIKKSIEKFLKSDNYKDIISMVKNDEDLSGIKYNVDLEAEKTIPLLGKIDAKSVSLPLVAIVMGAIDGFNPCAISILLIFVSLLNSLNRINNRSDLFTSKRKFLEYEFYNYCTKSNGEVCFVYEISEEIVGFIFAKLKFIRDVDTYTERSYVSIENIYVREEYRRRGIGTKLYEEVMRYAKSIRIKKISPWILNILRMSIYQIIFLVILKTRLRRICFPARLRIVAV